MNVDGLASVGNAWEYPRLDVKVGAQSIRGALPDRSRGENGHVADSRTPKVLSDL